MKTFYLIPPKKNTLQNLNVLLLNYFIKKKKNPISLKIIMKDNVFHYNSKLILFGTVI